MIPAVSATSAAGSAGLPYQWVAVGSAGGLYTSTSTTMASWTSRTSSFGSTVINSVASNGTSLYVAVGGAGKLATSPDGITWTQRTSSFNAGDAIQYVAYGNGYWVAVGDNGKVAYSTDGTTWTQKATGISASFSVTLVAWGNGLWIITNGSGGQMFTATDPTGTWTSQTSTVANVGGLIYFKGQSIWIAGSDAGTTNALASSTDGTTWTARTSTINISSAGGFRVACNGTVAAAACYNGSLSFDIQSSANGTTWTDRTPAISSGLMFQTTASDDLGLMFLPGWQTSTDGITWTARTDPNSSSTLGICHSSGTPSLR